MVIKFKPIRNYRLTPIWLLSTYIVSPDRSWLFEIQFSAASCAFLSHRHCWLSGTHIHHPTLASDIVRNWSEGNVVNSMSFVWNLLTVHTMYNTYPQICAWLMHYCILLWFCACRCHPCLLGYLHRHMWRPGHQWNNPLKDMGNYE